MTLLDELKQVIARHDIAMKRDGKLCSSWDFRSVDWQNGYTAASEMQMTWIVAMINKYERK